MQETASTIMQWDLWRDGLNLFFSVDGAEMLMVLKLVECQSVVTLLWATRLGQASRLSFVVPLLDVKLGH